MSHTFFHSMNLNNIIKLILIGLLSSTIMPVMAEETPFSVEKRVSLSMNQQRILQLKTAIAAPRSIAPSLRVVGKVIANPKEKQIITAPVTGKINILLRALPTVGYAVKKNQILTHIEPVQTVKESDINKSKGFIMPLRPQPVHSPWMGTLSQVWIQEGQLVKEQEKLFEITDPYSFWVEVPIKPELMNTLNYRAQAYSKQGKRLGIVFIDQPADTKSHTLFFRVESNQQGLKIDEEVSVYLQKNMQVRASLLPKAAVISQNQKHFIWIKDQHSNDLLKIEVKAYPVDEQSIAIPDLPSGTIVVLSGIEKIK